MNRLSELHQYRCPCCGAPIEFDSSLQKLKCPYCSAEYDVEALDTYKKVMEDEKESNLQWYDHTTYHWRPGETNGLRIYTCQSCGGEVVADESTGATGCPWCQSPVIMTGQFRGELRPDFIVPFKLNREQAIEALKKYISGKRFVPAVFKRDNHLEEIKGVYVPYWLFDTSANASFRYKATKVHTWSDKYNHYRETSHYLVTRDGSLDFYSVPVDASTKIHNELSESIEPYNLSEAVDFHTAYLSGYLADKYDVNRTECQERANERIRNSTKQVFAQTVKGYASVKEEHSSIRLNDAQIRYALLPVWMLTTSWEGKLYHFTMNGQTGKFVGNIPVDKAAYRKSLLLRAGVFAAGIYGVLSLLTLLGR